MLVFRVLGPGDQAALETFLLPRTSSSMILLSNSRLVGLRDLGERFHATYAAVFQGTTLTGVVAHCWNGSSVLQAPPEHAATLCALAVRASARPLTGMLGPSDQVSAALSGLGIATAALRLDSVESLFQLRLSGLRVPESLVNGTLQARLAEHRDLDVLTAWRAAFSIEALQAIDSAELLESSREAEERLVADGHVWLVEFQGRPVSTSGFNAVLSEAVQIGGVYTPPSLRGRGYARAAVAQSLLDARRRGVASSLLFTGDDNPAAQRAYQALGYERIGDYRIVTLRAAQSPGMLAASRF
jgi:GNAT superfamily N-acetyltransferase